jgi:hypothetical protein
MLRFFQRRSIGAHPLVVLSKCTIAPSHSPRDTLDSKEQNIFQTTPFPGKSQASKLRIDREYVITYDAHFDPVILISLLDAIGPKKSEADYSAVSLLYESFPRLKSESLQADWEQFHLCIRSLNLVNRNDLVALCNVPISGLTQ